MQPEITFHLSGEEYEVFKICIMKFDEQYFRSNYPHNWEYRMRQFKKEERMFDIILLITITAAIVVAVTWIVNS